MKYQVVIASRPPQIFATKEDAREYARGQDACGKIREIDEQGLVIKSEYFD